MTMVDDTSLPGCSGGCFAAFGILFDISDDLGTDNDFLNTVFDSAPMKEGTAANLTAGAVLDINQLLPENRTYVTYEGSLTTPPCTEGLLWHVMLNPMQISLAQYMRYTKASEAGGRVFCT